MDQAANSQPGGEEAARCSLRTGTIMERSHVTLRKWLLARIPSPEREPSEPIVASLSSVATPAKLRTGSAAIDFKGTAQCRNSAQPEVPFWRLLAVVTNEFSAGNHTDLASGAGVGPNAGPSGSARAAKVRFPWISRTNRRITRVAATSADQSANSASLCRGGII